MSNFSLAFCSALIRSACRINKSMPRSNISNNHRSISILSTIIWCCVCSISFWSFASVSGANAFRLRYWTVPIVGVHSSVCTRFTHKVQLSCYRNALRRMHTHRNGSIEFVFFFAPFDHVSHDLFRLFVWLRSICAASFGFCALHFFRSSLTDWKQHEIDLVDKECFAHCPLCETDGIPYSGHWLNDCLDWGSRSNDYWNLESNISPVISFLRVVTFVAYAINHIDRE